MTMVDLRFIPSRYVPVNYVETRDFTTYIKTNTSIRGNPVVFRVKYKFQFSTLPTVSGHNDQSFWGACDNGTSAGQGIKGPNFCKTAIEFTGLVKNNNAASWTPDTNVHELEMQVKSGDSWIKLDGTTKFTNTTTGTMLYNMPIYLFTCSGTSTWLAHGRLYRMEFYQDDKPLMILLPVCDTTTNKAGFYDITNNVFYGATAGTLYYGAKINGTNLLTIGGSNVRAILDSSGKYIFNNLFTQCSYIANSGTTEYIDTGIKETATNNWDAHFYLPSFSANYFNGSKQNSSGMCYNAFYRQQIVEYNYLNVNFTNTANDITITESLSSSTMSITLNGTTVTAAKGTPVSETMTILLFAVRKKDGSLRHYGVANCKLYYWKIRQGTTLVRDFVPVKTNCTIPATLVNTGVSVAANVYGLYDKVSGKFFANSGSGSFTGG